MIYNIIKKTKYITHVIKEIYKKKQNINSFLIFFSYKLKLTYTSNFRKS